MGVTLRALIFVSAWLGVWSFPVEAAVMTLNYSLNLVTRSYDYKPTEWYPDPGYMGPLVGRPVVATMRVSVDTEVPSGPFQTFPECSIVGFDLACHALSQDGYAGVDYRTGKGVFHIDTADGWFDADLTRMSLEFFFDPGPDTGLGETTLSFDIVDFTVDGLPTISSVPVPGSFSLLALGMGALAFRGARAA